MAEADFISMLGCRVRLDDYEHDGRRCHALTLRMEQEGDGRYAQVLLSDEDLAALGQAIRGFKQQ